MTTSSIRRQGHCRGGREPTGAAGWSNGKAPDRHLGITEPCRSCAVRGEDGV